MKQNEKDYLDTLFSSSGAEEIPQVEVPAGLSESLYAISDAAPINNVIEKSAVDKRGAILSFPKVAGIAASLFVAIIGFQFYQQQQTLIQLKQAQADLATALHYLGEANRITRSQVANSLSENMKKAGVEPAVEIGRDALLPNLKRPESQTQLRNRSL